MRHEVTSEIHNQVGHMRWQRKHTRRQVGQTRETSGKKHTKRDDKQEMPHPLSTEFPPFIAQVGNHLHTHTPPPLTHRGGGITWDIRQQMLQDERWKEENARKKLRWQMWDKRWQMTNRMVKKTTKPKNTMTDSDNNIDKTRKIHSETFAMNGNTWPKQKRKWWKHETIKERLL